jgi:hypothetical protein
MKMGNGVFQGFIKQHSVFNRFAANAVATLRVTMVSKDDGEFSVRACYLRLAIEGDSHVQSQTHIRVPIDMKTGAFANAGYLTSWLQTDIHPTSKAPFSGNTIPAFHRCLETVLDLHKKIPYVRCIGWDIAVDADEKVRIIKWNGEHNDIKFGEATQGPCFADLGWEKLKARHIPLYLSSKPIE